MLFGRILEYRSRILGLLIKLEHYRKFKQDVLEIYTKNLGIGMGEKPRLRICRNYGNESVCIATKSTTRWIGDKAVYTEFKQYLQIKKKLIEELKRYRTLLDKLLKSDYKWVRKLARFLRNEMRRYSRESKIPLTRKIH
ncbi:MAG: hypothetical protein QW836_10120 [Ignisphaera sp.]